MPAPGLLLGLLGNAARVVLPVRATNALHYQDVVEVVEKCNAPLRGWDVPAYLDTADYEHYDDAWQALKYALLPTGGAGLTLVSKVMMGVWGCVPSFVTYFRRTFTTLAETRAERGAFNRAGRETLRLLHEVWVEHEEEIERVRDAYPVWDFATGGPTGLRMPVAKVLDIYGFHIAWRS